MLKLGRSKSPTRVIYFDWGPDQQAYQSHVEIRKPAPLPPRLLTSTEATSADSAPEGGQHPREAQRQQS